LTNFEHPEPSLVQTYFETLGFCPEQRNGEAHFYTYSSTEEEYRILKQGVGCRLLPSALLEMQGNDALDFLHRITTNDLKSLPLNQFKKRFSPMKKEEFLTEFLFLILVRSNSSSGIREPNKNYSYGFNDTLSWTMSKS